MDDADEIERELRDKLKKVRPHAGYFDWPTKATKELGIVEDLIDAVPGHLALIAVRRGPDPPDAVGEREGGGLVAIEVTELVDEKVTGHNVRAMRGSVGEDPLKRMSKLLLRDWDKAGIVAAVGERLRAKDGVTLKGGPYEEYVVALHTDEPMLSYADAVEWLGGQAFADMRQVTGAYLLFSYDGEKHPCIPMRVT